MSIQASEVPGMSTDGAGTSDETVESMGAAMGGADTKSQSTSSHVPEADRIPYEEMVQRAAEFLHDGICEISQVQPKDYHDVSQEQFLDDVREKLGTSPESGSGSEGTDDETDTETVDWDSLWDEFGFGEPDAHGNKFASRTQLITALDCTDQACPSGTSTITEALEEGELHKVTADGAQGETITCGYVRPQGGEPQ